MGLLCEVLLLWILFSVLFSVLAQHLGIEVRGYTKADGQANKYRSQTANWELP